MIVLVMAISNLVLTRQIYSEETNGAHAHNRDHVPLNEEPTDPGKSLLGLSNLFFTWNFLDHLKQTFL